MLIAGKRGAQVWKDAWQSRIGVPDSGDPQSDMTLELGDSHGATSFRTFGWPVGRGADLYAFHGVPRRAPSGSDAIKQPVAVLFCAQIVDQSAAAPDTALFGWFVKSTLPSSMQASSRPATHTRWPFDDALLPWRSDSPIDERVLADPKRILDEFETPGLPPSARRALVLFSEPLNFDDLQRHRLIQHLWDYAMERRTSTDDQELVAVGCAIRKLIAYWPVGRFDDLTDLLYLQNGVPVAEEVELEVAKGLVYRFGWDDVAVDTQCPQLTDALFDLADFHTSKRALGNEFSSAIGVNAIIALAYLRDERVLHLVGELPRTSLPWFIDYVRSRVGRLLARLTTEQQRDDGSLGLLRAVQQRLSAAW